MIRSLVPVAAALAAAACVAPEIMDDGDAGAASLFDAPNRLFMGVEPSVLGLTGAPTVWEVLAPIGRRSPEGLEADQRTDLRIRMEGDAVRADIVQSGLLDDAVAAEQVRLYLRLDSEGWWVANAYVRQKCRRGADAGAWTNEPCP